MSSLIRRSSVHGPHSVIYSHRAWEAGSVITNHIRVYDGTDLSRDRDCPTVRCDSVANVGSDITTSQREICDGSVNIWVRSEARRAGYSYA